MTGCMVVTVTLLLLDFSPLQSGNHAQFGWTVAMLNLIASLEADWLASSVLIAIFSATTTFAISSCFSLARDQALSGLLVPILCLTNPLVLWSITSAETFVLPALSILMWSVCTRLQQHSFARSSVTTGMFLVLLFSATGVFLWLIIPLFFSLSFLISPRLLLRHRLVPLLIVMMPTFLGATALLYWMWSSGTAPKGLLNFISPNERETIWLVRHGGQFGSALGELICWTLLICPLVVFRLLSTASMAERKICGVVLMMPVFAAALASDFLALPSPLAYLTILVTGQIWITARLSSGSALAGQYISWLGSYLAIWYYAL
ncbi:MAG: hypothetical protein MRY59_07745 [Aquisalinus sp.]|nr:hypothetical protein [Aquisalinus sp.]